METKTTFFVFGVLLALALLLDSSYARGRASKRGGGGYQRSRHGGSDWENTRNGGGGDWKGMGGDWEGTRGGGNWEGTRGGGDWEGMGGYGDWESTNGGGNWEGTRGDGSWESRRGYGSRGSRRGDGKWARSHKEGVTFGTFNTVLVPLQETGGDIMDKLNKRADAIISLIENSDVDVFCLQKNFVGSIQRKFYNNLKSIYPYIFSAQDLNPVNPNTQAACTVQNLMSYTNCTIQCAGSNLTSGEIKLCMVNRCAFMLENFGQPCRNCILLHRIADVSECASQPESDYVTNYGLMLLSRIPLQNTSSHPFIRESQFRGFLEASVKFGNILCTHLSSALFDTYVGPPVLPVLKYQSYAEQQLDEVLRLIMWLEDKDRNVVLMGSFNHGPVTEATAGWAFPLHYGLMTARGLLSPYALLEGKCTYSSRNWCGTVDHIYIMAHLSWKVKNVERIFHGEVTSENVPVSTHSGVTVTVKGPPKICEGTYNSNCFDWFSPLPVPNRWDPLQDLAGICKAF